MNKHKNNEHDIDDQLADFTDQILNVESAKRDDDPFSPDPELRALEQTAQRLKNAFRDDGPSEKVIQRMHKKIAIQLQERVKTEPFWKRWMPSRQGWHSQRSRQQLKLALSMTAVLMLFLISIPLFIGASPDQPAASGQNINLGFLIASGGLLVLLAFLLLRRKQ